MGKHSGALLPGVPLPHHPGATRGKVIKTPAGSLWVEGPPRLLPATRLVSPSQLTLVCEHVNWRRSQVVKPIGPGAVVGTPSAMGNRRDLARAEPLTSAELISAGVRVELLVSLVLRRAAGSPWATGGRG